MKLKKPSTNNNNFARAELLGLLVGLFIMLLSAVIISYLILKEILPITSVGVITVVAIYVSAFLGNMSSGKIIGTNNVISGLIYAGLFVFIMLILNVILFSVPTSKLLIPVVAVILGSLTVCIKNLIPEKNKGYKKVRHG